MTNFKWLHSLSIRKNVIQIFYENKTLCTESSYYLLSFFVAYIYCITSEIQNTGHNTMVSSSRADSLPPCVCQFVCDGCDSVFEIRENE